VSQAIHRADYDARLRADQRARLQE